MNRSTSDKQFHTGNPIANVIVALVTVLAIGAFIVLGVFAAVALGGIVLLLAGILGIRMWWLGRKRRRQGIADTFGQEDAAGSAVIEGEYRVVTDEQEDETPD